MKKSEPKKGIGVRRKAIVLGGHYSALNVVRALGQNGIQVIVLSQSPHDHACHSKFVTEQVVIPDPVKNSDELLELLMGIERDWDGALLIPSLDPFIIFVSQNRSMLKKRFFFTVQNWDVIDRIINKNKLYPIAQGLDIPTPKIFLPESVQFIKERQSEMFYPCILKPNETHKFREVYGGKVLFVDNYQELIKMYVDTKQHGLEVMISEIIPGDDTSIFSYRSYIDSHGEVLAEMCTQKLRQYPTGFGQGSVVRTIPMIPEVRNQALKLLRKLSYRGQSSTEFRLDSRDGQYKLMEINTRPVVTEWLFVKAGINFPYLTYLDLVEDIREKPAAYLLELYWIHNIWESMTFVNSLVAGNLNLGSFFDPYWKKKVFILSFFEDPLHFLIEIFQYSKKAITRVLKRKQ
jgi:predicted ATP-grasp superfamily ATP-dependent carboligase